VEENFLYLVFLAVYILFSVLGGRNKKKKQQKPKPQPQAQPQKTTKPTNRQTKTSKGQVKKQQQRKPQTRQQQTRRPQTQKPASKQQTKKKKPSTIETILQEYLKELDPQYAEKIKTVKTAPQPKPEAVSLEVSDPENIEEITKHTRASVKAKKYEKIEADKKKQLNIKSKLKNFKFNPIDAVIYHEIFGRKY